MHTGMERGIRRFSARPKDTLRRVFHIPVRKGGKEKEWKRAFQGEATRPSFRHRTCRSKTRCEDNEEIYR